MKQRQPRFDLVFVFLFCVLPGCCLEGKKKTIDTDAEREGERDAGHTTLGQCRIPSTMFKTAVPHSCQQLECHYVVYRNLQSSCTNLYTILLWNVSAPRNDPEMSDEFVSQDVGGNYARNGPTGNRDQPQIILLRFTKDRLIWRSDTNFLRAK